ncbi:MAG: hypothetical protein WAV20_21075 [Blastocatellia bacterium]
MNQGFGDHKTIAQYLLGELSDQEKARLEEQYFADDDLFEEFLVVEGELTDAYVRGELYGRERERFEARFLVLPRQHQRVEIARALVDYATESSALVAPVVLKRKPVLWWPSFLAKIVGKNRAITLAFAAAVIVILVGGSLFIVETVRLRNQVERIEADRTETLKREQELERQLAEQGQHNEQLAEELQRERSQRELLEQELIKPQRSTLSAITFILTPDLVRGAGEPKRLIIPQHADLVRVQIGLDQDDHKSYRVFLETVDGKRIWGSGSLKVQSHKSGKVVTLGLPASLFTKRDYIMTLSGVNADGSLENVSEYYFSVLKK